MKALRLIGLVIGLGLAAAVGYSAGMVRASRGESAKEGNSEAHAEGDGHDHSHGGGHEHGADPNQLPLSEQARANLGLNIGPVALGDFWRSVVVPGVVAERPGHSERRINAAISGVVTKVRVSTGQTVRPGDPLFDVQSTGEVLANAQASLLKTLQDLELVETELRRIEPLAEQGSIPAARVIEKKYERQRLESLRLVQMQELIVRGLSQEQIAQITEQKTLLREFTVHVPGSERPLPPVAAIGKNKGKIEPAALSLAQDEPGPPDANLAYSVEAIDVFPGKLVQTGDALCDLALHDSLRIEGLGFQGEAELIANAIERQSDVTAVFESNDGPGQVRERLKIQYADNVVDPDTRVFRFYLPLSNEVARDFAAKDGTNFRTWRFKPGQRVQLRVPVELWENEIVLPTAAVVREGPDAYVFRVNGNLMERVPVSVAHEDGRNVVLSNDGSVFEGDEIALNEAYQLNLALKKAQGGGADLHAGHNH